MPAASYRRHTIAARRATSSLAHRLHSLVRRGHTAVESGAAPVEVDLVAEFFLMRQLTRAFLAAPWNLPEDANKPSVTLRESPGGDGWPFPINPPREV